MPEDLSASTLEALVGIRGALNAILGQQASLASQLEFVLGELAALGQEPKFNDYFDSEAEARLAHALVQINLAGLDKAKWSRFPEDVRREKLHRLAERLEEATRRVRADAGGEGDNLSRFYGGLA